MTYKIQAGLQVSLDNITYYALTDHNRAEIGIANNLIETSKRMANGAMKKYVVANKRVFTSSWKDLPSSQVATVDLNYSSAWVEQFYRANLGLPIYLKLVHSRDNAVATGSLPNDATFATAKVTYEIIQVFFTKFDTKISKRNGFFDYVTMDIEFTEI